MPILNHPYGQQCLVEIERGSLVGEGEGEEEGEGIGGGVVLN